MRLLLVVLLSGFFWCSEVLATRDSAAAAPNERWLKEAWTAKWITHPAVNTAEFGVYLFRKDIELPAAPERFVVHVTADARYRLFVNGESVVFGPQRSDAWVWHYETIDLSRWLRPGRNVIAAQVWSYGAHAPYAITGNRTGFLLQGDGKVEEMANTDASWKVTRDESYTPLPITLRTYLVIGPGLRVDGAKRPWGWREDGIDTTAWPSAREIGRGNPYGLGTDMDHWLRPRTIPLMEERDGLFSRVRRIEGGSGGEPVETEGGGFRTPANSRATVLLDNGVETNAFPRLVVSGGKGSRVKLTYAEALIDARRHKGDRNEVEGRTIEGVADEFLPDGGERREFTTLDFRTFRYVQIDVETAGEPLTIEQLTSGFTGYPFEERGSFSSDDAALENIWEVGWRTARLCAFETYVDCPYYEQLQYVGDTRIQALISLYVSGDDRLMRNAIELFDRSRIAEGLTQSRYPSKTPQVINTFSLFWIDMVHDYWMHRRDDAFVSKQLPGVDAVLGWFERKIDAQTGLLGSLEYWTFVDWTDSWRWDERKRIGGEPPGARTGGSSIVSFQLVATLERAAELSEVFGRPEQAAKFRRTAGSVREATKRACWDEGRSLFADTPEKRSFSQHANAFAVLAGAVVGDEAKALMQRVADDRSIEQASTYFQFYVLRALKRAGLGDQYVERLGPWHEMLATGLTTFAEKLDPTRSDCHAWSSSPVYEFLATVAGIEPASSGFETVRIEPHLGALKTVTATVPHPRGEVSVALRRAGEGVAGDVTLPQGVTGEFRWKGARVELRGGTQAVRVE